MSPISSLLLNYDVALLNNKGSSNTVLLSDAFYTRFTRVHSLNTPFTEQNISDFKTALGADSCFDIYVSVKATKGTVWIDDIDLMTSKELEEAMVVPSGEEVYDGIVENGGFEKGSWNASNLSYHSLEEVTDDTYSDSYKALQINSTKKTGYDGALRLTSKTVSGAASQLDISKKYTVSLMAKGKFDGSVYLELKNGSSVVSYNFSTQIYMLKDNSVNFTDWHELVIAPFNVTGDDISITLIFDGVGSLLIDNVNIIPDPQSENLIENGGFEYGAWTAGTADDIVSVDYNVTYNSAASLKMTGKESNKVSNGVYKCPCESCKNHRGIQRVLCKNAGSIPIRALYVSEKTGKEYIREITIDNMPKLKNTDPATVLATLKYKPQFTIPENWDRQHEDKLFEKGVVEYSDFFTSRNYLLNCLVFNEIMLMRGHTTSKLNEYLYFLFSSSLRYTNNMTRVTNSWEGGKPTAMDKHAFWLPNQYVETNVLDIIEKRSKAIINGCTYSAENLPQDLCEVQTFDDIKLHNNSYMVLNQSSTNLPIPDEAIDVIITDPPYGSNVQYAELSSIWNAWYSIYGGLDSYIYNKEEAVVNRKQKVAGAKTEEDYEHLLYSVYTEGARVLKPDGYLVFTFNNKNIKVWVAMLKAVAMAGFYLPDDGIIFQDYIESYKNTAHLRFSGNIQGDFIYSFRKGSIDTVEFSGSSIAEIIDITIDDTVKALFRKRKKYSTPDLYQKLMSKMTSKLMQYILCCVNKGTQMEDISKLSNDYLDNRLKQSLTCEDGVWKRRNA